MARNLADPEPDRNQWRGFCGGPSNATGLRFYLDAVGRPATSGITFTPGP
jgi:hypothetical protein